MRQQSRLKMSHQIERERQIRPGVGREGVEDTTAAGFEDRRRSHEPRNAGGP